MNATPIPRVPSVRLPSRSTPKIAATLFSRDFVWELRSAISVERGDK
jgi:hypothetical protein